MIYKFTHRVFDTLLIFMLIMSSGGMLFVLNRNIASVSLFILLLIGLFFFGNKLKRNLLNSSLLVFLFVTFLGIINYYFAIGEQSVNKYMFHLLNLVICILTTLHFINNRNNDIILRRIYFILKIISIHAFLSFILYFFINTQLSIVNSSYNEFDTFYNIFFYKTDRGLVNIFGLELSRNQGLFWEPGILQIFLNILFFLEAFIIKENRRVLIFTAFLILTTYSTTGLVLLLLQIIFYIRTEFKKNKLLIPIVLALSVPIYLVTTENIDDKIRGDKESSFQKRLFDLTQPIFIALEHPVTGIGLDLFQFQKMRQEFYVPSSSIESVNSLFGTEMKLETTDKGSSNSIMFLFACTGFPTTLILLYMFLKQQIVKEKRTLWLIILIVSVMSEPLLLRPFFFIFIVSGFIHIFYKIVSHKNKL